MDILRDIIFYAQWTVIAFAIPFSCFVTYAIYHCLGKHHDDE